MANASLTPIISNFEKLFSKLNERFYNNELQAPVITISPDTTKGAYGWCTGWRAWAEKSPKDLATLICPRTMGLLFPGPTSSLLPRWAMLITSTWK